MVPALLIVALFTAKPTLPPVELSVTPLGTVMPAPLPELVNEYDPPELELPAMVTPDALLSLRVTLPPAVVIRFGAFVVTAPMFPPLAVRVSVWEGPVFTVPDPIDPLPLVVIVALPPAVTVLPKVKPVLIPVPVTVRLPAVAADPAARATELALSLMNTLPLVLKLIPVALVTIGARAVPNGPDPEESVKLPTLLTLVPEAMVMAPAPFAARVTAPAADIF